MAVAALKTEEEQGGRGEDSAKNRNGDKRDQADDGMGFQLSAASCQLRAASQGLIREWETVSIISHELPVLRYE